MTDAPDSSVPPAAPSPAVALSSGRREFFRVLVGFVVLSLFSFAVCAVLIIAIPATNRDIAIYVLGQLSGFAGAVIYWVFGSSQGSAQKDEKMAELIQQRGQRQP